MLFMLCEQSWNPVIIHNGGPADDNIVHNSHGDQSVIATIAGILQFQPRMESHSILAINASQ
jgi:hypothetical protein